MSGPPCSAQESPGFSRGEGQSELWAAWQRLQCTEARWHSAGAKALRVLRLRMAQRPAL